MCKIWMIIGLNLSRKMNMVIIDDDTDSHDDEDGRGGG